jgi:hypothetical protein
VLKYTAARAHKKKYIWELESVAVIGLVDTYREKSTGYMFLRKFKNHDCFALIHRTLAYLLILSALRVMLDGLVWF